jgi:hypothetical protein
MYILSTRTKNFLLRSKTTLALSVIVGIGVGNCSTVPANKTTNPNSNTGTGDTILTAKAPSTRDKWLWPFASTSPWNMPIGSDARYVPANLQQESWSSADVEYLYRIKDSDPVRSVYMPGAWGPGRCTGTTSQGTLQFPDNVIVPDATQNSNPNNPAAFLMPDGKTLAQLNPFARCNSGGNLYGWRTEDISIYGDGLRGGHGGSGLSSIGGSIRLGELTGNKSIRHALKINIWAEKYLYYSSSNPGYRWPADRADSSAAKDYRGNNPKLVMGALLAIPPSVTVTSLGLQTPAGRKLFHALQNYGGYVVDSTGWNAHALSVEKGVLEEFRTTYGYNFESTNGAFYDDFMKLFQALHIVDNNGPNNIGGGGKPRVSLAPPIGN